jgi:hypothetical protein
MVEHYLRPILSFRVIAIVEKQLPGHMEFGEGTDLKTVIDIIVYGNGTVCLGS